MRALVRCALTALLAVGLGVIVPPMTAASAATTSCDDAAYPSLLWVRCSLANSTLSTQNSTQHGDLLLGVGQATADYVRERARVVVEDPERQINPNNCSAVVPCLVDPRVTTWARRGGLVEPVLFTSRSGSTLSGHVWATADGPAKRPGVVIVNGSIAAFEQNSWYLAQSLARAGFVVMTFDAQGEGMSDQFGEAPDQLEAAFAGIPGLGVLGPTEVTGDFLGGNGLPFYDGAQDALDFFLSTPNDVFVPRPSRTSQTSHGAKQRRRVLEGRNPAYNPLHDLLDRDRIGLSGHSYGAMASSWLAQKDPRVDAAVALDSLCVPVSPAPDEVADMARYNPDFPSPVGILYGFSPRCFGAPPGEAPRIAKPSLGITSDYLGVTLPYPSPPHPLAKARASLEYSRAGVDTGQIVIRGGTHLEFSDVPVAPVPATLRGIDLVAWYTTAWFAKYLQRDPSADRLLLTDRWQQDAIGGGLDPLGDANLFSWHLRSRLDIRRQDGSRFRCEDLRQGCTGMVPAARDTGPETYTAFP